MCAVAYTMLVEQIERRLDVEETGAIFSIVMGGKGERPDREEVRARFHRMLCAPVQVPRPQDRRQQVILAAMGMRGKVG